MPQSPAEFMAEYERCTTGHDRGNTMNLIAKEAVYFFSDQSRHIGKSAISQVLGHNFDLIEDETYRIKNLTWLVETDDVAVCVYDYSWNGTIKGKAAAGSGRGTSVIHRIEGKWRIIHEHLSPGAFAV